MFSGAGFAFLVRARMRDTAARRLGTDRVVIGLGVFAGVRVGVMAARRRVADGIFSRRVPIGSGALIMFGDTGCNFFVGVRVGDMTARTLGPGDVLHRVMIGSGEAGAEVNMFAGEGVIIVGGAGFDFFVVTTAWSLGTFFHRVMMLLTALSFFHWVIMLLTALSVCVLECNLRPHRMGEMGGTYASCERLVDACRPVRAAAHVS